MDKLLEKTFEYFKDKSLSNTMALFAFFYFVFINYDSRRIDLEQKQLDRELDKKKIESTIALTNAIEKQNSIFKSIEKEDKEFRDKSLKKQDRQLALLKDIYEKVYLK